MTAIQSRKKQTVGYVAGVSSVLLNVALFVTKLLAGREIGSVAIIADAWHTLSDTLTSLVVILGVWVSSRPRDADHPFGHGRAELVASVVIGTMLGLVAFSFTRDAYHQLRGGELVSYGRTAYLVLGISVVLKEGMAQFAIRMGKRHGSQSVVADGWHHRSDAVSSAVILVGALAGRSLWWIDSALGFGVALLILYAAYEIIRDSAGALMGERPDDELTKRIREVVASSAPAGADVHHLHLHRYGDHVEVTMHTRLPESLSLGEAHAVVTDLENELRARLGVEPTIHVEPSVNREPADTNTGLRSSPTPTSSKARRSSRRSPS